MTTTDDAKLVLSDLEARLVTARADLAANQARRDELAFDAHTGDAEARREAAALVKAAGAIEADIRSLGAAVAEAGRRVSAATAAERDEVERGQAKEALAMLDAFAARGAALDARLGEFVAEYGALCDDFRKLEALGYAPTTFALVGSNMRRAVATKLMTTDLRQDFLAPHLRTDFVSAIEGWARHLRAKATARLNRNKTARAA